MNQPPSAIAHSASDAGIAFWERLVIVLILDLLLLTLILAVQYGLPEDMGCGFDYSGLPIPCRAP